MPVKPSEKIFSLSLNSDDVPDHLLEIVKEVKKLEKIAIAMMDTSNLYSGAMSLGNNVTPESVFRIIENNTGMTHKELCDYAEKLL